MGSKKILHNQVIFLGFKKWGFQFGPIINQIQPNLHHFTVKGKVFSILKHDFLNIFGHRATKVQYVEIYS